MIILFLLCIVGSFFLAGYGKNKNSDFSLEVETPEGHYIYPLDKDGEYYFKGYIGITHVFIKENQAWVEESPCENKVCINMGKLSRPGNFAACLPNGIILSVDGEDDNFDAMAE